MELTKPFPVKRKTFVDFIRTEVTLGEKDGEVVVTSTAQLQLNKMPLPYSYDFWHKRFPFISRKGIFTVVGRAVCGDEPFDFEKGKRIAETRAQAKAYSVASRVYETIVANLQYMSAYASLLMKNCDECLVLAEKHVVDLDS